MARGSAELLDGKGATRVRLLDAPVSLAEMAHTRVFYWVWVAVIMATAHVVLFLGALLESGALLCVGVALGGTAFGHAYPLLVICTGDLFGKRNLGANYMLFDGYASA